jgi:hypothetical protein
MRTATTRYAIRNTVFVFLFALILALTAVEIVPAVACERGSCAGVCCAGSGSTAARTAAPVRRAALPAPVARDVLHSRLLAHEATLLSPSGSTPKPRSGYGRFSDWARAPSQASSHSVLL